jgi:cell division protein FtsB
MKNIHLIPTDKPSRLILQDTELYLSKYMEENEGFSEFNQNIYITSDEQIKEGDYFLYDGTGIRYKSNGTEYHGRDLCHISGNRRYPISKSKKIILTTDQDLIKDGVQTIGDEFLEWFVKNPNCEWVEITKDKIRQDKEFNDISHWNIYKYKIVIPKEEPKQETTPTPIEKWIYDNTFACDNACKKLLSYLGLSGIPDPKKWVKEMKDENKLLKRVLKSTDDSLTCISWDDDGPPIRLKLDAQIKQLEAENEKLKAEYERLLNGYKYITGFETPSELSAYEKGREHEEKTIVKFIQDWKGETNSVIGQLLADKVQAKNEKLKEENEMLKRVLKLKLEAENEKIKKALGRIYTMDTSFENYINAIVELKQIAGDAIK